ncbi:hypothetical protein C5167_032376 [Papaver somniferum]|uniref:Secreted protein n=1 Tax=Papaver somniferum TaxID=3469 RepID=A0A4Y7K7A5_PAPSO|nr:hypothetical protein C5167_032376 [Papaver somniferum]
MAPASLWPAVTHWLQHLLLLQSPPCSSCNSIQVTHSVLLSFNSTSNVFPRPSNQQQHPILAISAHPST